MTAALSSQDALVAVMILVSAVDNEMSAEEMKEISATIEVIPAFENYDRDRIGRVSAVVAEMLQAEDGLDALMGLIKTALPDRMRETGYALACDVAAADGALQLEELRLLELLRHGFEIDRLIAAGIERGARARHTRLASDD